MHAQGAELAFSYANDKLGERVEPLAAQVGSTLLMPLDVQSDEQIDAAFARLKHEWGRLDIVVHAVAFAPREALAGSFTANTSREAFRIAHDVSSYSFTALARGAAPLMLEHGGALLTLSYLGAVRSIPSYNVMGLAKASLEANVRFLAADLGPRNIRVNAISAGPIKTLAAAGIGGFRKMLAHVAQVAPLRRNVTHRGRRQCGGIPVLRHGGRHYRRGAVRRQRLQHRGHELRRRGRGPCPELAGMVGIGRHRDS